MTQIQSKSDRDRVRQQSAAKRKVRKQQQEAKLMKYQTIGKDVGTLVDEKNAAYGDSFAKCGEFLKLLYPNGIKPEQYTDALCLVRIFDKQMRIATKKDAFGESPYRDIVGYGLLGTAKDEM